MVVLIVYVDDILVHGSDLWGIEDVRTQLQNIFQTKDNFLGIKVAHGKKVLVLSKWKHVQN